MAKRVILVKYSVKPGVLKELLACLEEHIRKTRETEPGCLRFDVLVPDDEDNEIWLHEVYADEEAFKRHNASEQLAAYRKQSAPLLSERIIRTCTVRE